MLSDLTIQNIVNADDVCWLDQFMIHTFFRADGVLASVYLLF